MALLDIRRVVKHFGGIRALDEVDIVVNSGDLIGLIGPNGSGKTTLFNCITGELNPDSGVIYFNDTSIMGLQSYQIALRGVVRTYQQTEIFPTLSVLDNLLVAAQEHQKYKLLPQLTRARRIRNSEASLRERAAQALETLDLVRQAEERAGSISYGQRKLLSIGMALMAQPRIMLLDEPTAAVNPTAIAKIVAVLRALHRQGFTMVIIEHNLRVVMDLCERIIVLNGGRKLAEGTPEIIRSDPRVIEAYFGA